MDEVLTWEEIERRFDGEWVVLDEPELTDKLEILRGRVVYHGESRAEAHSISRKLGLRKTAVWFLGPAIPEGSIAVL